jgi:hypothetical protein
VVVGNNRVSLSSSKRWRPVWGLFSTDPLRLKRTTTSETVPLGIFKVSAISCSLWPLLRISTITFSTRFNENRETQVSKRTVQRSLYQEGYNRRVVKKKVRIREVNRKKRVKWAREKLHWRIVSIFIKSCCHVLQWGLTVAPN